MTVVTLGELCCALLPIRYGGVEPYSDPPLYPNLHQNYKGKLINPIKSFHPLSFKTFTHILCRHVGIVSRLFPN